MLLKSAAEYNDIVNENQSILPSKVYPSLTGGCRCAFVNPNIVLVVTILQLKAVKLLLASVNGICQYPHNKSNVENQAAPAKESNVSSIRELYKRPFKSHY